MKSLPILALCLPTILGSCLEPGKLQDLQLYPLNKLHSIKTSNAENCQLTCQLNFECSHFTWYSEATDLNEYDNDCVLHSSVEGGIRLKNLAIQKFYFQIFLTARKHYGILDERLY